MEKTMFQCQKAIVYIPFGEVLKQNERHTVCININNTDYDF